ncbi:MAG: metalloprotease [Halobacteriota archaeon]
MSMRTRTRTIGGFRFSEDELRDLAIAWVALGVAFAVFFAGGAGGIGQLLGGGLLVISLGTAGVAFLLHEVAHKVVAVRFGQIAEFRADYSMLFLAVMSAMLGFIFAAPGAVHHRGYLTRREHGQIALAGPVTNLGLAIVFLPIFVTGMAIASGFLTRLGWYGVLVNLFLAAFNMIPYGPLDGKTVLNWSKPVWAAVFVPSVLLTVLGLVTIGF